MCMPRCISEYIATEQFSILEFSQDPCLKGLISTVVTSKVKSKADDLYSGS